jgi:hypothetical protein
MTPKRAALIGLVFPVIALIYWALPTLLGGTVDWAGITMLIALGAAMALMAYVLVTGMQRS